MSPAFIQWSLVGEVIGVSFVAGLVAVALFATVILGSTRGAEARRGGRSGTATAYTALAFGAFIVFLAMCAFAIYLMTQKG